MKTSLRLYAFIIALFFTVPVSAQQWEFAKRFGSAAAGISDAVSALCTDAAGNVYVTGNFHTSIDFGTGVLTATPTGTPVEAFVAKFNAAGVCQWAIDYGGAATDNGGSGIITDGTTVYVTGAAQFPCTIGSSPGIATVGGSKDGIVFALNASTGATVWARAFGGANSTDQGQAICMDNTGHIYITGIFSTRTGNPTASFGAAGAFTRTVQGNNTSYFSDCFVAQLNAATGNFNWVSTGGASAASGTDANDNISGSGIAFLPGQNQLVIAGSFAFANAAYCSNGSATPSVTLTNAGDADICLLKMDLSGNFLSGLSAGGAATDEALAVTYDATTSAVYINGYFNSASMSGALNLTNGAAGFGEIYYARYDPAANSFTWAKNASGSGHDRAFANDAGATGIYITGRYQNTISFPAAGTPLTTTSAGGDEVFLLKIDPATGNAIQLATASSPTNGTDAGTDVVVSTNNNVWVGGIFSGGTLSFTPSSPAVAVTAAVGDELFIARYNDPPPAIVTHPAVSTRCPGLSSSFIVTATGNSLKYQWEESTDAGFSSPVTLTNTGIYSNVTTATLIISDNTTVSGRYYRVKVSNSGGSVTSNGALLNTIGPVLPASHMQQTQWINTVDNIIYGPSCELICKVVPSGASPLDAPVTSDVWVEGTVPKVVNNAFAQRHYQIIPAFNPLVYTATVTLYYSQAEFNAFNTARGSAPPLPTGPTDNIGKANLRIGKYRSSSNDGSGLPASYSPLAAIVIDPPDANITWNAITGMWQITFDVQGFGGFFLQTFQYPLPLKLLSFAAQLSGTDVKVSWKVADEQDHDHYELERSIDGRSFTGIASIQPIAGSGNKNYDFTDVHASLLNTAKIYYRLKMVSVSGTVDYSKIVVVYLKRPSSPVTRIGPNPFKDKLEIGLYMPESGRLLMKLTDQYGRTVVQENIQAPKGFSTYVMSKVLPLMPGMYALTVNTGGQVYSFKVMKQL